MYVLGKKLGFNNNMMGRKMGSGNVLGKKLSITHNQKYYMPHLEKEKSSGLERDFRHNSDHINTVQGHLPLDGQDAFQHHSKKLSDRKSWQRKKH